MSRAEEILNQYARTISQELSQRDVKRVKLTHLLFQKYRYQKHVQTSVSILKQIQDLQAILSDCDDQILSNLIQVMHVIYFEPNEIIFKKRDPADAFYIILNGTAEFFESYQKNGQNVEIVFNRLGQGKIFGQKGLMSQYCIRTLSARACGNLQAIEVLKSDFEAIISPKLREIEYKKFQFIENLFPQGKTLNSVDKERLIHLFSLKILEKGTVIIQQGKPSDCLYFICEGECTIVNEMSTLGKFKKRQALAMLGVGSFFGEETALFNQISSHSVIVSSEQCRVMQIAKKDISFIPLQCLNKIYEQNQLKQIHRNVQPLENSITLQHTEKR